MIAQSEATSPLTVSSPSAGGQSMRITSYDCRGPFSAFRSTSSRPILPDIERSTSARIGVAGMMPSWTASEALASPESTSATVGAASGGTSK
jgi:hypothetical protein